MPFLDDTPWAPSQPMEASQFKDGVKLYRVPQTGEIYDGYNGYVDRLRLLQSNRWTSLKGSSGLNYSQAIAEDSSVKQVHLEVGWSSLCCILILSSLSFVYWLSTGNHHSSSLVLVLTLLMKPHRWGFLAKCEWGRSVQWASGQYNEYVLILFYNPGCYWRTNSSFQNVS